MEAYSKAQLIAALTHYYEALKTYPELFQEPETETRECAQMAEDLLTYLEKLIEKSPPKKIVGEVVVNVTSLFGPSKEAAMQQSIKEGILQSFTIINKEQQ